MAEEDKKDGKDAKEEKKGKGLLFIVIGVIVVVIILIAVVVFMFMGGGDEHGDGGGHGGGGADMAQIATLSPEQQMLIQNEAYKNPIAIQPLEKDFIINLKSPNPDNLREGGYVKFKATLLLAEKGAVKEVDAKLDIVRSVITDAASSFTAIELQGPQGRQKLSSSIVASLNSVLTDGKVASVVFPDFILQP